MLNKVVSFFRPGYQPLNRIKIDKNRLISNYDKLDSYNSKIRIAPVLKSNAYGHGLTHIAKIIDQQNPPFICVDSLPEAKILKKFGVKSEILIMGSIAKESLLQKLPFHLTVTNHDMLENISNYQPHAKIHLFVDTGMNREGIRMEELENIIAKIKNANVAVVGIMTHLAIAAESDHKLTMKQIKNFMQAKKMLSEEGFSPKWAHIGGSDSVTWISPEIANLVRCGRLLYGIQPNSVTGLKPALELETSVVQIKMVKKGESIGYSATFTASKDMKIALLPIGYNDGVDRRLSNKGSVVISGIECQILGLISMNMTVIDVTRIADISIGQKAVIFSSEAAAVNSIENSAQIIDTNPSDLLVGLHPGTRRESN